MDTKRSFAIQSLIVTLVLNAILLAVVYLLVGDALQAANQTLLFVAIGGLITLLLWGAIYFVGSRFVGRSAPEEAPRAASVALAPPPPVRARPEEPSRSAEVGAVQMLAILQRQGRLIDFLQENLSMYDDAQIGAAVRTVHEGTKQALAEHVTLEPIFPQTEGSAVAVEPGFDTRAVRLTGHVVGEPPFRGELRHRGWRVERINLPQQPGDQNKQLIVAAAEVEVP